MSIEKLFRYAAMRPVAYAYRDGGIFADTNYAALPGWASVTKGLQDMTAQKQNPAGLLKGLPALSDKLWAQYVLADVRVDSAVAKSLRAKVVWSNELLTLAQCHAEAKIPRP